MENYKSDFQVLDYLEGPTSCEAFFNVGVSRELGCDGVGLTIC